MEKQSISKRLFRYHYLFLDELFNDVVQMEFNLRNEIIRISEKDKKIKKQAEIITRLERSRKSLQEHLKPLNERFDTQVYGKTNE